MNKKHLFETAKTVAIYGIDEYSNNIYNFFSDIGKKILYFIDDNDKRFKDIDTINERSINNTGQLPDIFFIAVGQGKIRPKQIIKKKLIDLGISENKIFSSWNMWRYGYDFKTVRPDDDKYKDVVLEIVDVCNAKCPYCPAKSSYLEASKKFVEPYVFNDTINILIEKQLIDNNSIIFPYNWGEPLLHPEINNIFRILHNKKMFFNLSTNASIMPDFDTENINNLQDAAVSMSGFTQGSYDKIHGFKLENILRNIDKLVEMVGADKVQVIFHVYQFNINEVEDARVYFFNKNIRFTPIIAQFIDYTKYLSYAKKTMKNTEYDKISKDLILYYADDFIKLNGNHKCMWFNQSLAIDTNQNYVTCCSLPKNHKNYSFGNVKELSKSEVNKLKVSQDVCKECNKAGITFWMNNILGYDDFYINGVFLK